MVSSRSRPVRSMAFSVGTRPMGVSEASPRPATRSTTHSSTRLFSPNPGHRNFPSASLRNQFTQNIFGRRDGSAWSPMDSQWAK